jgi:ABC-type branched-subunit amino acid transport system permease subunit
MGLNRDAAWVLVALVFAVALPVLVFYTGTATLGPYARGGLGAFLTDYLADLARFRLGPWVLLLGPVALVIAWRVLVALAWPRTTK